MSTAERKAMEIEIQRQLAEYTAKHEQEIMAVVLWVLHKAFGFGEKRLKRFYECFDPEIKSLIQRYEMDEEAAVWLCTNRLKEAGIDIEKWEK